MSRRRTISPPLSDHERVVAGEALLANCQRMYCTGELSAKGFCELVYYASRAGAVGADLKQWGLAPQAPGHTGNYSRRIELCMENGGYKTVPPVNLSIPFTTRQSRSRAVHDVPVRPFHELLAHELHTPLTVALVRERIASKTWPRVYTNRQVVATAAPHEVVVPLGVFLDAAQYGGAAGAGRSRSVLVISLINLCTQRRHVGVVFRKHLACHCGCRGWCSYWRLLTFLRWSIDALASGVRPRLTWDGGVWPDSELERRRCADTPFGFKAALCYVMADWEAMVQFFSIPAWDSASHCCPICDCTLQNRHMYRWAL